MDWEAFQLDVQGVVDDLAVKGVDVVETFHLQEQPAVEKKMFVTFIEQYHEQPTSTTSRTSLVKIWNSCFILLVVFELQQLCSANVVLGSLIQFFNLFFSCPQTFENMCSLIYGEFLR